MLKRVLETRLTASDAGWGRSCTAHQHPCMSVGCSQGSRLLDLVQTYCYSGVACTWFQDRTEHLACHPRRDQLAKLSVHVEIASELNRQIDDRRLTDLGKLEQVRRVRSNTSSSASCTAASNALRHTLCASTMCRSDVYLPCAAFQDVGRVTPQGSRWQVIS